MELMFSEMGRAQENQKIGDIAKLMQGLPDFNYVQKDSTPKPLGNKANVDWNQYLKDVEKEAPKQNTPYKNYKGETSESKQKEDKSNAIFESYYKSLKLFSEQEWDLFYQKLKEPLDICFRINSLDPNAARTRSELKQYVD